LFKFKEDEAYGDARRYAKIIKKLQDHCPKDEFDKIIDDLDKFRRDLADYNMSDDVDVVVTDIDDSDDD
jgi:hypothetical protein